MKQSTLLSPFPPVKFLFDAVPVRREIALHELTRIFTKFYPQFVKNS